MPEEEPRRSFRSQNFLVKASTLAVARQIARAAERQRKEKALEWLGEELPPWREPCPIEVKITDGSPGVSASFDGGQVRWRSLKLNGPLDRLMAVEVPHGLTHVVFADHFGRPVPRWADEGAASLSETTAEMQRHEKVLQDVLDTPDRPAGLRKLFAVKEYPRDLMAFFAEGYSVTKFMVESKDRRTFLAFLAQGQKSGWDEAVKTHYGYADVEKLEAAWLQQVKHAAETPKP
jgi:hypothetical protein